VRESVLVSIPALIAWGATLYKVRSLRHNPRDPIVRAFWWSIVLMALALTVLAPPVALWIDRATGIANIARLLGNGLGLAAGCQTLTSHFLHLDDGTGAAPQSIHFARRMLVGTLIAMVVLFVLAPVHREAQDFWQQYGHTPFMLGYRLLFLGYLGLTAAILVPSTWQYAAVVRRPTLSLSLRLIAIGAIFGAAYVVHEALHAMALAVGVRNPFLDSQPVATILITLCVAFMLTGSTMPAWSHRLKLAVLLTRIGHYHVYWRLYPLWIDLCRAFPEIALFPPRPVVADALTLRDLDLRLYRRVVEIRDGMLALRPYVDPVVMDHARLVGQEGGLPPDEIEALMEAAGIVSALRARNSGRYGSFQEAHLPSATRGDVDSEARALERVAHYYRHSSLLRGILDRPLPASSFTPAGVGTPKGTS
jgi:hypothetical protein